MPMRPLNVIFDITDRCNLRCMMCHFSSTERISFPPFDVAGPMPVALFEKIAREYFPHAHRVVLGSAAEPLMHPHFADIVTIAGRYGVPDLWFPTNLLPLTDVTAKAIVDAKVNTVGVSIDGVRKETYEAVRVGATWERLMEKLEMLRTARRSKRPAIRLTFTWMRRNRDELREMPAFAASIGATELDVRMIAPAQGADVSSQLLSGDDLHSELMAVARDSVRRGLRLMGYPKLEANPRGWIERLAWRFWRLRAGLDRFEHLGALRQERAIGCRYPDTTYVIRPNGAVFPCQYFDTAIGFAGTDPMLSITGGQKLKAIREGLKCGSPVGACATCGTQRRDSIYRIDAGIEASH